MARGWAFTTPVVSCLLNIGSSSPSSVPVAQHPRILFCDPRGSSKQSALVRFESKLATKRRRGSDACVTSAAPLVNSGWPPLKRKSSWLIPAMSCSHWRGASGMSFVFFATIAFSQPETERPSRSGSGRIRRRQRHRTTARWQCVPGGASDRRDALAPASELGVLHCRFQNADLL